MKNLKLAFLSFSLVVTNNFLRAQIATPRPIINWQFTAPANPAEPTNLPQTFGENWFYNITPTSDGGYLGVGYLEEKDLNDGQIYEQPLLMKLDANHNRVWEHVYDDGHPDLEGDFWKAIEVVDPNLSGTQYLVMGIKADPNADPNANEATYVIEVAPSDGHEIPLLHSKYYGPSDANMNSSTSTNTSVPSPTNCVRGSIEEVFNSSGGNDGYIICGDYNYQQPNPNSDPLLNGRALLIRLRPDGTFDQNFGHGPNTLGYQTYQPANYPVFNSSGGSDVTVINNGTGNESFAITGFAVASTANSCGADEDIMILGIDKHGATTWQQQYNATTNIPGYTNRTQNNSSGQCSCSILPPSIDRGMNIIQLGGNLVVNAECSILPPIGNCFPNQNFIYPAPHQESYQSFTDALIKVNINTGAILNTSAQTAGCETPFDGIDFFPRIVAIPLTATNNPGGIAVAGNLTYHVPAFNDIVPSDPRPLGVEVDLVQFDSSLNKVYEQQYRQYSSGHLIPVNNPVPADIAITCQWGLCVSHTGGLLLAGNNEINDEDYALMDVEYPTTQTSAISQLDPSNPLTFMRGTQIQAGPATIWSTSRNIQGVVDILPGATLLINNNATISFADQLETGVQSKIVVERGGHLIVNGGATLTAIPGTTNGGTMWGGIEAWGNGNNSSLYLSQQSTVNLNGATVSNAIVGYSSIKTKPDGTTDPTYTGGSLLATNHTNFTNCYIGADFFPQQFSTLHRFIQSDFLTSNSSIGHNLKPAAFVSVNGTRLDVLNGCTFQNGLPLSSTISTDRGNGIVATDANVTVSTSTANMNTFTGLFYAIHDANTINPLNNFVCTNNTFTDNYQGVYLKNSSFGGKIEYNTFQINSVLSPSLVLNPPQPYCLYLDACDAFSVQQNKFNSNASQAAYGTIVNASGSTTDLVNNNTYNNFIKTVTFFSGTFGGVAQQAQGNNGGLNTGLEYKCNQNGNSFGNHIDFAVPNVNYTIQNPQGQATPNKLDYANNTFTHLCNPGQLDFYSQFTFTYNNLDDLPGVYFTPSCYSAGVMPSSLHQTTASSYLDACPPPVSNCCTSNNFSCCRIIQRNDIAADQSRIDSLNYILALGDAQSLINIIATGNPGQIQNALLGAEPYLSDRILIAAINRNLPPGTLKNIIIPNSPVDAAVMQALTTISLPPGIRKQINDAQANGISARQLLQNSITVYTQQKDLAFQNLIRTLLEDTTINGLDSAKILLSGFGTKTAIADVVSISLSQNDTVGAAQELSSLDTVPQAQSFVQLAGVLLQLESCRHSCSQMSNAQKAIVLNVAQQSPGTMGCAAAQGILCDAFGMQFPEEIDPIMPNNARMENPATGNGVDTLQTLDIYPNPANDHVDISYHLNENAELVFYNVMGQQTGSVVLQQGEGINSVQTSDWSAGIYFYRAITKDRTKSFTGKLLISH